MSFVSRDFALLLAAVLLLLLVVRLPGPRKVILLAASCAFYAYWDWRFLGLLAFVTVLDYSIARYLAAAPAGRRRKMALAASVAANLGLLAVFKYLNFSIDSLNILLAATGWHLANLSVILPVGISFYTFETLSYVIDVYRGEARPTRSLLDYAIFVTFFPRLVAGPIMRARHFLPQLERGIRLNYANVSLGGQLFVQGLLKKVVIADNLSLVVDQVYAAPGLYSSATVWLGVLAYSVQILCDFSGYTDMAIGVGRMLAFELPRNFDLPYSAQSISEFWQRWHISLSTWLRDYLYIPLGGNRRGQARTYLNVMVTMLLGGLWHGASWSFVLWGGLHGVFLVAERLLGRGRPPAAAHWRSAAAWARASAVFVLVSLAWVLFRSPSLQTAAGIFSKLLLVGGPGFSWLHLPVLAVVLGTLLGGFAVRRFGLSVPVLRPGNALAPGIIVLQLLLVFFLSPRNVSPFIYFQF